MAQEVKVQIFRGDKEGGEMVDYHVPRTPGMVVLDAVHSVQSTQSPDLGVRWNCKAGKCGSCSAEVNGKPKLMCMDRLDNYDEDATISIRPMKTFPIIKDLVCDVSWNYKVNEKIIPFTPKEGERIFYQYEADRVQEFRKCIECFLCQDVCHVLREHELNNEFIGPRFLVRTASLEMHPLDVADRSEQLVKQEGLGYCNITKCCSEVCPESIAITDNAIIPLKERMADKYYDPLKWLWRKLFRKAS